MDDRTPYTRKSFSPSTRLTGHSDLPPEFRRSWPSAMRQAGVSRPKGSHAFRHGFATRMLQHGQSIKTIADLLGHRNINTPFIYTKVDFETLRRLPLDWPEV